MIFLSRSDKHIQTSPLPITIFISVTMGCFQSKEKYTGPTMGPRLVYGAGRYEDQPQGRKPRLYNPYTGSEHVRDGSATWEDYPGEFRKEYGPRRVVIRQR